MPGQIKTYDYVNREDHSLSFGISRMEDIYVKREGVKDDPHRHDFYTVLLIKDGKGEHVIDFNSFEVKANQIYFIKPGQVHQLIEEQQSIGYSVVFSEQFLAHNNIPVSFIENLELFQDFGNSPPLELDEEAVEILAKYAEELLQTNESGITHKYRALGSLLTLLLIHCNNLCNSPATDQLSMQDTGHLLLRDYKALLAEKFSQWHGVAEYADALHVTADHLNRVVKSLTGKTAKEHIQSRIIVAAKRLIYFSDLSNKELAYELGFSEPANFSAFFKKCTGQSPSEFKKSASRG